MEPPNVIRPVRKIPVSDKLWECFDLMAREMGGDREGLVNQALFTFARLNGYLTPGSLGAVEPKQAAPAPVHAPAEAAPSPPARREVEAAPPPPPKHATLPPAPPAAHRKPPTFEAAPRRTPAEPPPPPRIVVEPPAPDGDEDARREVAERVLETADALTRDRQHRHEEIPGPEAAGAVVEEEAAGLCLMAEDGKLDKVVKDRFIIGRGKHCDLVINSGKVSREHAAITKEGAEYFIEDLGSSNGTWYNKQRIRRRKIEDGDEFFICSEKVKCVFR